MIHYIKCPLSDSVRINEVLKAKDHTATGETFGIWENKELDYRFTNPLPEPYNMQKYYKADAYISHTRTRKGLINQLYHLAQLYTMRYKRSAVQKSARLKKGKILDYGCGTAAFASHMRKAGWDVSGYEPDENAANYAREKNNISLISKPENGNLKGAGYHAITLWHVLEHVPDPHQCLIELKAGLHKNGAMLIALPNFRSLDAEYYGEFWAGYDVPRHIHHFSFQSFKYLAEHCGLTVSAILPMHLDGIYVSMLSEKYLGEKGSQIRGITTGIRSWLRGMADKKRGSSVLYVCKLRSNGENQTL